MIRLTDLLHPPEVIEMKKKGDGEIVNKDVRDITVRDLSKMGLMLIGTEYGEDRLPEMFISAEALRILQSRALKLNASIFYP